MWIKDLKDNKWYRREDSLNKGDYNNLRQDLEDTFYYGKCFDGTTYVSINETDDIYSQLKFKDIRSWTIVSPFNVIDKKDDGSTTTNVSSGNCFYYDDTTITGDKVIDTNTIYDQWYKYNVENGFTIKNKFTPSKVIEDSLRNFLLVDVATTTSLDSLTEPKPVLTIDDIRIINGHRVLVKDQKTYVTLDRTVNPNTYFKGNYYITQEDYSTISYYYYNEFNGIYEYTEDTLIKTDDLSTYDDAYNYSVSIKLGTENRETQYHLSRLLDGEYPLTSENDPIEFKDNKNWLIRNHTEYQNILDLNIESSMEFDEEIIDGIIIEKRVLFVAEFGTVFIRQGGELHNILNDFKYDLKAISSNKLYYFVVGERGKILKIDKVTLKVTFIDTKALHTLNDIEFYNDNLGLTVGEQNTIYYTLNGGYDWLKYTNTACENIDFNRIKFIGLNKAYIVGDNGTILYCELINNKWSVIKLPATKIESIDDSFLIVDHITDIKIFNSEWSGVTDDNNEKFIFAGINSLLGFYNINDDNLWSFVQIDNVDLGDIKSIEVIGTEVFIISDMFYKIELTDTYSTLSEYNNIFYIEEATIIEEFEYNNSSLSGNIIYLVGDDLNLKSYNTTDTSISDLVTQNFKDRVKSRMLFMDYDTASKLNWFGDNETYRLPNDIELDGIDGNSIIEFKSLDDELNWIDYDKDILKVYRYGDTINDSSKVEYNTKFNGATPFNSLTLATFTNDYEDIEPLLSLSQPTNLYDIYMYDNLSIIKVNGLVVEEGDVLYFTSNEVTSEFMVNRIETFSNLDTYAYLYTNFNEEMTNNIVKYNFEINIVNLNRFDTLPELMSNFNRHKISYGYKLNYKGNYIVTPLFNNKTAYYNLQLLVLDTYKLISFNSRYEELFVDFGYTANYSILSYLNNISSTTFTPDKIFFSMPAYKNFTFNNANIVINENKLSFNPSLKFEWETFWVNTFIDIELDTTKSGKYLILDKYYDEDIDRYIISLHKEVDYISASTINLLSRRTLSEISSDLNELNNIQRNYNQESNITSYKKEIIKKFNTDSYTKVMISDGDIKTYITAILYTDFKNEYTMNVVNLPVLYNVDIIKLSSISEEGRDDGIYNEKVKVITEQNHNLNRGDFVMMNTDTYKGLASVKDTPSPTQFVIDFDYISSTENEIGDYILYSFDPSFNYSPLDVIDVGTDAKTKISQLIRPDKVERDYINQIISIDVDTSEYRFNLIDGLYLELVAQNYPWILEAEIENALIGKDDEGNIVWYKGIWECGRWFYGTWYSGVWLEGEWYDGIWNSNKVTTTQISGKVDANIKDDQYSKWFGGNFRGGIWNNGSWYDGKHFDGDWIDGDWFDGNWYYGNWFNGRFMSGNWVNGKWYNGTLNCDYGQSTWLKGEWQGGDFECGIWENGNFSNKSNISRFGTKPFNSRKALWKSGKWYNGEFHSILNTDSNDEAIYSLNNKYSIFETGIWYNGEWYGGTSVNINYQNGIWSNGVVKDINIVSINEEDKIIKIEGIFNFNNLDDIFIIRNGNTTDLVGNEVNYGKYIVKKIDFEYDVFNNPYTNVYVFNDIPQVTSGANYKMVSKMKNIEWGNGIFFNGIFESGLWKSGIFINGTFIKGEWV